MSPHAVEHTCRQQVVMSSERSSRVYSSLHLQPAEPQSSTHSPAASGHCCCWQLFEVFPQLGQGSIPAQVPQISAHSQRSQVPQSRAAHLCEIVFLTCLSIWAYVVSKPSGRNTASQPKLPPPRAGTMDPSVRPVKVLGSSPGPAWIEVSHRL